MTAARASSASCLRLMAPPHALLGSLIANWNWSKFHDTRSSFSPHFRSDQLDGHSDTNSRLVFTARCYAERDIGVGSRPSVLL